MKVLALAIVMLFVSVPAYAEDRLGWKFNREPIDISPEQCEKAWNTGKVVGWTSDKSADFATVLYKKNVVIFGFDYMNQTNTCLSYKVNWSDGKRIVW